MRRKWIIRKKRDISLFLTSSRCFLSSIFFCRFMTEEKDSISELYIRFLFSSCHSLWVSLLLFYLSCCINISFRYNIIQSTMQLLPLFLLITKWFGRKRPSSGASAMLKLFHCIKCSLIHITCQCDI
jgi:hypothetical protein